MPAENTVLMEGVRIVFRNFQGKEGQYNRAGDRNFGVVLPPDLAERMLADGWNVKYLKPREDEEEEDQVETPWLSVSVNFDKGRPPKIMMVTSRGRTAMDEKTVEMLAGADTPNVDLIVRPSPWEVSGRPGVKPSLQTMSVTSEEAPLEAKYADMDAQ